MKVLREYVCWNCKVKTEGVLEYGEYPECPKCNKDMEYYFSSCNFDSFFPGSHRAEYTSTGRKFNGCTKEQLLESVSFKKRVAEGRKKKGHEIEGIDNKKHTKRIK